MPIRRVSDGALLRMRSCEALIKARQINQASCNSPGYASVPGYLLK